MEITARQRKILLTLLQKEMKVKDLSRALDVSTRTIHRDLNDVEKILFDFQLELEKKPGVGLRILGEEKEKQQLSRVLSGTVPQDYTQKERQAIILSMLFEAKEPIKLFALAHELDVSIATVRKDLDQLEEQLKKFHLTLIRKRGYGVIIEGEEANKRFAITHLISDYVDPFEFVSLLKENIKNKRIPAISNRLIGLVNPEKLHVIEEIVESASTDLPYELADSSYFGLVIHLALALERLQKGESIQFDQADLDNIKGTKEYIVAEKIIFHLKDALNIDIPDDEIGYITMHLLGAKLRADQNYLLEAENTDIVYRVKQLIAYVHEHVPVDLRTNNQLLHDLVTHLKPAIYRMEQQMIISNPMLDQIKQDYRDLFLLIDDAVKEIFPDLHFPEDEIGYLVLHFAAVILKDEKLHALVICSSGLGTAKILAAKLMKKIPQIKHVENKSLLDVQLHDISRYDLIVSTIPLKQLQPSDYILVSPMLNQSEVSRVKKAIRQKKTFVKRSRPKGNPNARMQIKAMKYYLDAMDNILDSFYVHTMEGDKHVLESICVNLEKRGRIRDRKAIYQKLSEREQLGGLGIPNTALALYHTRSSDIQTLLFSVYKLNHPMTIQGMDGEFMEISTILMMLAPQETRPEYLEVLSYVSSLLIQDKETTELLESANEEAIKLYLAEQFQSFLKDKQLL